MSRHIGLAAFVALLPVAMPASAKTFIDYFLPIPITSPLTTNAWGCTASGSTPANCTQGAGVVPRDTSNGIESPKNAPSNYYWDGCIVRANGTYHMFTTRWPGSSGFNPGWLSSDPIHAVGSTNPLGPYVDKGYAYSNSGFGSDPHHGHNLQVITLLDGTYAMVVSEVVAWTIFTWGLVIVLMVASPTWFPFLVAASVGLYATGFATSIYLLVRAPAGGPADAAA